MGKENSLSYNELDPVELIMFKSSIFECDLEELKKVHTVRLIQKQLLMYIYLRVMM